MIHGIDDTGAWEERSISLKHVRNVLKNVLKIEDADNMVIVDCHRLPQRPVSSNESGTMLRNRTITEKRYPRPIIFKLESVLDVQKVWSSMNNLKEYNETARMNHKPTITFTKHLPDVLQKQRKLLVPKLVAAKKKNLKASIRLDYDKLEMYLHIVTPTLDSDVQEND